MKFQSIILAIGFSAGVIAQGTPSGVSVISSVVLSTISPTATATEMTTTQQATTTVTNSPTTTSASPTQTTTPATTVTQTTATSTPVATNAAGTIGDAKLLAPIVGAAAAVMML